MPLTAFAVASHRAPHHTLPRDRAVRLALLSLVSLLVIATTAGPAGAAGPATAFAAPAPSKTGAASTKTVPQTVTKAARSARTTAARGKPATPRQQLKREAEGLALATTTVETITEAQLDVAMRVLTGAADCEFNERITVAPVNGRPGHFHVGHMAQRYTMVPEETATGAVRLVDRRAGVVWLQIPVKSMLMNSKQGRRMVDACTHAEQRAALTVTVADAGIGIGIAPVVPAATAATVETIATNAPAATTTAATLSAASSAAATEPPGAPGAPGASGTPGARATDPMATAVTLGAAVVTRTSGAEPITAPASAVASAPAAAPAAAPASAPPAAPAAGPASGLD